MVIRDQPLTVNKEKIVQMLKAKLGLSSAICAEIVNQIFANITQVAESHKLSIKGFGSFYVNTKKPRPGINFHTKEKIIIPSKKVMQFTPAKKIKTSIQDG